MEITVSARHMDVSEALREVTVEKIGRLSRFLEGMDRAEVHFTEERNPRIAAKEVCEVTLEGHGHHVRCKVAAPDGFAAVDAAVEKLEHQLHKLKSKLKRHIADARRTGHGASAAAVADTVAPTAPATNGTDAADDGEVGPRIVKSKLHDLKPMTAEEAVLQLDLVDHDFYVFVNAETDSTAVVYRRRDGDLGLIDTST